MGISGFGGQVRNYLRGAGASLPGLRRFNIRQPAPQIAPGQQPFNPRINFPSSMPKGASMTPAGDIGERRQRESVAVGGFKDGETVRASRVFKGGV